MYENFEHKTDSKNYGLKSDEIKRAMQFQHIVCVKKFKRVIHNYVNSREYNESKT